ncbi:MAG: MFS transporter, partial [Myxococcota bacterium]
SLQFTSLNTLAYAEIGARHMSRATTLSSVSQQLSLSFGVGLGALLLHATLVFHERDELGATDFSPAYFAIAAISLLSLRFFTPLPRDAGAEISGRHGETTPAIATAHSTYPSE